MPKLSKVVGMMRDSVKCTLRDLLAGFVAIFAVLASAILTQFVGSDLRVLFAVTATAFFFAGLARGHTGTLNIWLKGVLVSSPGLLGTAALILNDGLHRLGIPIAVSLTAILLTVSGVQTRRSWTLSRRMSSLLSLASIAAVALLVLFLVPRLVIFSSLKNVDQPAPSFSLSAFDGKTLTSSDLRGHVVVLAFWATWCLPCRWELPELEPVYQRFQGNSEVVFLAVDADWGGETTEKAKRYLKNRKLNLPAAYDSGGAARALGVDSLPTIVPIDQAGRVRMTHYGYDASEHVGDLISKSIEQLLAPAGRSDAPKL